MVEDWLRSEKRLRAERLLRELHSYIFSSDEYSPPAAYSCSSVQHTEPTAKVLQFASCTELLAHELKDWRVWYLYCPSPPKPRTKNGPEQTLSLRISGHEDCSLCLLMLSWHWESANGEEGHGRESVSDDEKLKNSKATGKGKILKYRSGLTQTLWFE